MISIVIPTYNERENIVPLIKSITSVIPKQIQYEIIIVDDDSPDGTAKVIKNAFGNNKKIKLYIRTKSRDLGTAILTGIRKSNGNVIVGMDADFNHPPEKIPELVKALDYSDFSLASRFIAGGGMDDKFRYTFTLLFNLFLKYILGFPTTDNMSGFYAIIKSHLLKLPLEGIYKGYGEYHLRLVYHIKKSRFRINEVPVYYKRRQYGQSKSNLIKMFFNYLWIALKLKLRNWH